MPTDVIAKESGGGNPYHDERGRFTTAGGRSFAKTDLVAPKPPEKLMEVYGVKAASDRQVDDYVSAINALDSEITDLYKPTPYNKIIFAIDSGREVTATHQGNWIILGRNDEVNKSLAQHEFIHHALAQSPLRNKVAAYHPANPFQHAAQTNSLSVTVADEDLTMTLTSHHPDRAKWASRLADTGDVLSNGKRITLADAEEKVAAADRWLKMVKR